MSGEWLGKIQLLSADKAAIFIYGDIKENRQTGNDVSAESFLSDLNAIGDISEFELHINSFGGSVDQGLAIYSALLQHPATVTGYIDGVAASMAGVIAMACDKLYIADAGLFMIHNPRGVAIGEAKDMRKSAETADVIRSGMIKAYQRRVAMTDDELVAAMDEETYYTAQQAVELGFADEVFKAQQLAAHINFDFDTATEEPPMSDPTTAAAETAPENVVSIDDAKKIGAVDALTAEDNRIAAIKTKFAGFPQHQDLMIECLTDRKVSASAAGDKLLAKLSEGTAPVSGNVRVEMGEADHDKFKAAAVNALLAKLGVEKIEAGNTLRNVTLVDLIKASAEMNGRQFSNVFDKDAVVRQMQAAGPTQTTSDFPMLLEDAMHKVLNSAFDLASDTWNRWCGVGSVSDFRVHNRYKRGSIGPLEGYNEAGEFEYGTIPDAEREQQQVATKGKIVTLTREMIVNDDLSGFSAIVSDLGRAAALSIETDAYAALALNGNLGPTLASDGLPVFDAAHGNIGTPAALTSDSLEEARILMKQQTDVGGNNYLNMMPSILLVPLGLYKNAWQSLISPADPQDPNGNSGVRNVTENMIPIGNIVDTPYLAGTRWYLLANPATDPVVEVAFLNGERSPMIDQEDYFASAGVRYRVMHEWGVAGVGYRGAVTNAGA